MRYLIPTSHQWCSYCIKPEEFGAQAGELCDQHRGPNGEPILYTGPDAYVNPDPYIYEVMENRYTAYGDGGELRVWQCFGYDPRHGFWMKTVDDGPEEKRNISGRAIGATWHPVRMTYGAWQILERHAGLGRMPTQNDFPASTYFAESVSVLRRNGLLTPSGDLTPRGLALVVRATSNDWPSRIPHQRIG